MQLNTSSEVYLAAVRSSTLFMQQIRDLPARTCSAQMRVRCIMLHLSSEACKYKTQHLVEVRSSHVMAYVACCSPAGYVALVFGYGLPGKQVATAGLRVACFLLLSLRRTIQRISAPPLETVRSLLGRPAPRSGSSYPALIAVAAIEHPTAKKCFHLRATADRSLTCLHTKVAV
eukprot:6207369-Pleurochrysis_carterae.AAC.2